MARWEEALDMQLGLWKLSHSEFGERFYDGYYKSVMKQATANDVKIARSGLIDNLNHRIKSTLSEADPIYVDEDMFALAEHAFENFNEEPLLPSDLITPNGFLYLPRPIMVPDIHNMTVGDRAFLWRSVTFNRRNEDGSNANISAPGLAVFSFSHAKDKDDYWKSQGELAKFSGNLLWLNHVMSWVFDDPPPPPDDVPPEKSTSRYLQALFRLMLQTISVKTVERASRPVRRRLEKEDWKNESIVVVTLRRPKTDTKPDETHSVDWSHRWVVRGFWRNQWFPSLGTHRQIYIHPYVKGPADKPLEVNKGRVYQWTR